MTRARDVANIDGILTAKGDIYAASAAYTPTRLAVGSNDTVLTADSSTATGLKWATPTSGSLTLISTTSLSGSSTSITSIPSTYTHLQLELINVSISSTGNLSLRFNNSSSSIYASTVEYNGGQFASPSASSINIDGFSYYLTSDTNNKAVINIYFYNDNFQTVGGSFFIYTNNSRYEAGTMAGGANLGGAISSIQVIGSQSISSGTAKLYGVK
jgi:hypothetical protein